MDDDEFIAYANRIVGEAQKQGAIIRLLGAVAFHIHCPTYGHFQQEAKRHFTDLDFAAYFTHNTAIRKSFLKLGFEEDREVAVVFARQRLIYNMPGTDLHVDIFFDKLDFCHPIPWAGRLEVDSPTIPLAELLLEKMQIVQINPKDVIDTVMLLREHPLDNSDQDMINANRIAMMCARDWGLWRTVTMNLKKTSEISRSYDWLAESDRQVVDERINQLLKLIEAEPKPTAWNIRNKIGDRVKWYKDVHEVIQ
ncbi:MAG TPA: hypothetical protein VLD65_11055 [Anaerolineales bacterium]|nr:hypothetical protein [Anaerolineales bacterium]